ncbi:acetolactate decarboxylase [Tenacibaculum sp. Mcav3-52]|uniref:acetolactate decarboxylase n=1 Tax=Tenacibaculum sp. Mcav3-52 TaxID=2917762 RepID=UPI001EF29243|nr:acetolactate decarboxylase [Tenacibaculum sp. Mcav3-52]MCG7501952.1 acetolactate decarboxylase [Tenacibaculum sp. Mcav3-52]
MKQLIIVLLMSLVLFSCKAEKEQPKEELIMYQSSEMAALMNAMYEGNMTVKNKILEGESIGDFPETYLNIHSAVLTDPADRNASFEAFSKLYIQNIQQVYLGSKDSIKQNFNKAVNSCIACHKTTCTGPIPRIKKLLIK